MRQALRGLDLPGLGKLRDDEIDKLTSDEVFVLLEEPAGGPTPRVLSTGPTGAAVIHTVPAGPTGTAEILVFPSGSAGPGPTTAHRSATDPSGPTGRAAVDVAPAGPTANDNAAPASRADKPGEDRMVRRSENAEYADCVYPSLYDFLVAVEAHARRRSAAQATTVIGAVSAAPAGPTDPAANDDAPSPRSPNATANGGSEATPLRCGHCHGEIAAGAACVDAHNGSFLHPQCEKPFMRARFTEEGILWDNSSAAPGTASQPRDRRADSETGQFDWAAHIEAVVADIFGACNEEMSREPEDVRFGNHGSVSVNYTTGIWYDHENERGGGVKELIRVYKEIDDYNEAINYAEECQQNFENGGRPSSSSDRKSKGNGSYQRVVEATYPYHDAAGLLAFEVVRFVYELPGEGFVTYVTDTRGKRMKEFRQRRPS
jgi:hypothetical protein